ncbi:hypothetical protein AA13595_0847 [Gluconacetobacter johannae DSM 13595]|uniref:Polysaccharide pyruvyl transferase domain-containing protein n=1 Tax=Gluconacetobacter johannae TaxID=112140 RepID=A0A7W4P4L5_9PROT|nr:polysaccharide pyruvyl transferase family protein [Gluconacetobacter johannae]MBB2177177.1 hypothetical protein [Gluconacetobacter johannae]GBQ82175.1 hypothetical protein AA13595_0847 [Gluconacetobacter johannae DSM 13595]
MTSHDYRDIKNAIRSEIRDNGALVGSIEAFAAKNAAFYPGYGNLGDALIAVGTFDLFDDLGWTPSIVRGRQGDVFEGHSHIVFGGGGGWVRGLWETYAEAVLQHLRKGGEILFLPSSFSGFGSEFVPFSDQVTIFCRERRSVDLLLEQGVPPERIFLSHDMAFYTRDTHFADLDRVGQYPCLNILRADEESTRRTRPRDSVDLPLLFNDIQWDSLEHCLPPLRSVAGLLTQFASVRTDRLHMTILACLLGRTVEMEGNSYFKNRAVFDYSICRFPQASFRDREREIRPEEQGEQARTRLLRDTIRRLSLDRQAEREKLGGVLRQNDMLVRAGEELRGQMRAQLRDAAQEKDRLLRAIEHLEEMSLEFDEMKKSKFNRLKEHYYTLLEVPGIGRSLRTIRNSILR